MQLSGSRCATQQRLVASTRTMAACVRPAAGSRCNAVCTMAAASTSSSCGPLATRAFSAASRSQRRSVRALSVRAEISYVMVKPDGVQRGLVGDIISRFERKGFKLVALKLYQTPKEVAEEHYKDLSARPFYNDLVKYIVSGPVVSMVWEGDGVVASARKMIGATNPLQAEPGTIRGDFAIQTGRNIVHGSDSPENGERETALWFPEGVLAWDQTMTPWLKE